MRTVDIRNLEEARELHPYYDAVVSVIEDDAYVRNLGHSNHHIEVMGDYSKAHLNHYRETGMIPRKEQIERILAFVNTLPKHAKILVHCAAGISRSTSTGLTILASEGWSEYDAVRHLKNKHPQGRPFWPNDIVIGHADEILGTDLTDALRGKRVWDRVSLTSEEVAV
jgi:predicted protein tyrosine phosphatase